jgi:prepilin-type N-terminal cleavage/methylation domain-containing protein
MHSASTRVSRTRAFTLIELLVVVAIIALLISILLPSLQDARKQAQAAVCGSNTKQILTALFMYQQDYRGHMPPDLWSEASWPSERVPGSAPKQTRKWDLWFYTLYPQYAPDEKIFICPGDPIRTRFDFEARLGPNPHGNAQVPSCGYALNYLLRHMHAHHSLSSFNLETYPPTRPGDTILMSEVGPDDNVERVNTQNVGWSVPWRDGGRMIWDDGIRGWYNGPTWLTARHMGKINMASMDGAVKRVRSAHLLTTPPVSFYLDCAGDTSKPETMVCSCCRWQIPHYNFSHAKLWWWTGPDPVYADGYDY